MRSFGVFMAAFVVAVTRTTGRSETPDGFATGSAVPSAAADPMSYGCRAFAVRMVADAFAGIVTGDNSSHNHFV